MKDSNLKENLIYAALSLKNDATPLKLDLMDKKFEEGTIILAS